MPPHMICVLPFLSSNATVRRLRISLPLVACLLDGEKYFSPDTLPPPAGDELRPLFRPRLTPATEQRPPPRLHRHHGTAPSFEATSATAKMVPHESASHGAKALGTP